MPLSDRELDALVAEKVMGWENVHCKPGGNVPYGEPDDEWNRDARAERVQRRMIGEEFRGRPDWPHEAEVPRYSTSISDAWEVVEKVGYDFSLYRDTYEVEVSFDVGGDEQVRVAKTAPRAICLAALAAAIRARTSTTPGDAPARQGRS